MSIKYNFNRSGSSRKPLVEAVSQMLDQPAVYQGAPTFAYIIGAYSIDKDGVLSLSGNAHPGAFMTLIEALRKRGFEAEEVSGDGILTVEMPKDGFTGTAMENLRKIIASKEGLIKKAIGAESLPVIDTGATLKFPWFTLHGADGEEDAYSRLVAGICKMAKGQKRVTARKNETNNEKFDMRLFLVRLGFIGDEYKAARKLLLKNLTGNSSWKSGHSPERLVPETIPAGGGRPEKEKGVQPMAGSNALPVRADAERMRRL